MSLRSPTMPSATTTTTHSLEHREDPPADLRTSSADSPKWTEDVNTNPLNPLDFWFEQTTNNAAALPASQPAAPSNAPIPQNSLADMIANPDPNLSSDMKTELEQQLANNTLSNPFASGPSLYNNNATPVTHSPPTHTPPLQNKPRARRQQQPQSTKKNVDSTMVSKARPQFQSSTNSPVTSGDIIQASSGSKRRSANSPANIGSPLLSQSESGSHSNTSPTTNSVAGPSSLASTVAVGSGEEDPMAAINELAAHVTAHDGLSAVERAKRSAEEFTMSQLAKRKRKATSPPITNSQSDDDGDDANGAPERQSHKKYQKRLQKNRDSAFVSRIRRREYTRILENSLSSVEKEKDAALAAFREMKRRFDVVSAELAGIKTAAASNFAGIRDTVINSLRVPDVPSGIFVPPPNVGFNPGTHHSYPKYPSPFQPIQPITPEPSHVQVRHNPMTTTMYMVALVVGVLIPSSNISRWTTADVNSSVQIMRTQNETGQVYTRQYNPREESSNHLRGMSTRIGLVKSEEYAANLDSSLGAAERVVNSVGQDAVERLGQVNAQRAINAVHRHLRSLSAEEVDDIERAMIEDNNYSGFEALVRAVIRDDGGHVEDDDDLDQIVKQVNELNFEDRL